MISCPLCNVCCRGGFVALAALALVGAAVGFGPQEKPAAKPADKAVAAAAAQKINPYPLDVCIISGEKLGGMGKPVFLLDRYDNCWRWLHGRTDSPWYPSMTIFRQQRPGDWAGAMHRAASALGALAIFKSRPLGAPGAAGLASAA